MNSTIFLNILKNNPKINKFLREMEDLEILLKKLNFQDIERINLEFPDFLKEDFQSILCITLVKSQINKKDYKNIKKIKIYIDEINEIIIRILEN